MEKENVLFIAYPLYEYTDMVVFELQKKYNVTFVAHDKYRDDFWTCYGKSFFRKIKRKLRPKLFYKDIMTVENEIAYLYLRELNLSDDYYSKILCIEGAWFPDFVFRVLKDRNPNAKFILYQWDDVANLRKTSHFKFFDYMYSYNLTDCEKYHCPYLPVFSKVLSVPDTVKKKYDITFIGHVKNSDRLRLIKSIYKRYKDMYSFFLYLYQKDGKVTAPFFYNVPLPFDEYLTVLLESRTVIELPKKKQTAPTTRCFDAIQTHTKVITINSDIQKYPFYDEENYLCIDKNFNIPMSFIQEPYKETPYKVLTCSSWLMEMGF